ncbi:uncharacterized protein MYCFIDRAFT_173359 [Pseudocercospora fijiensis CIRAD86]|uniref:Uncharacterized protein n=1 Tax=Pseudocercospora fijiensis (strain CIRAD86) TaxID=383855 RepID=M2ZZL7_PSEFD|nr:uncharacterized protein MYCFIDRAFT_173359 [Pseudocercospora fijiensis CIRAD86]EME84354.1 hypothetical protein MYCFIDRAFT_173359 [Pseudocercospora fijiensis CIRAD86]
MVQYTARPYGSSTQIDSNDCATYWMLDDCSKISDANIELELKDKGIFPPAGTQPARRIALLSRAQRGLLIYEKCTLEELRRFCMQRAILKTGGKKCERSNIKHAVEGRFKKSNFIKQARDDELITLLETADEHSTLERFLDLDPAIRKQIFSMHLSSLEYHHIPTLPPVTRVSRLIRQETYPLFYDLCPANIRIARKPPSINTVTKLADPPFLPAVERFFTKHTLQLNRFRRINVLLSVEPEAWKFTSWRYTLKVGEREVLSLEREEKPHNERKKEVGLRETRVSLNKRMQELVDDMVERGDGIKFRRTDWKILKGHILSLTILSSGLDIDQGSKVFCPIVEALKGPNQSFSKPKQAYALSFPPRL